MSDSLFYTKHRFSNPRKLKPLTWIREKFLTFDCTIDYVTEILPSLLDSRNPEDTSQKGQKRPIHAHDNAVYLFSCTRA